MDLVAVFVHLGKSPAKHLWLNLQRHQQIFPKIRTYLILDERRHLKNIPSGIDVYLFKRESEFLVNDALNSHDQKFRRGFWRFSLERLFALAEFHKAIPENSILHIESDVFLLPNFPWNNLSRSQKPMWNNYNTQRDVSALLFYPNYQIHYKTILKMQDLLVEDPSHTDMTILAELRNRYSDEFNFFPSLSQDIPELKNSLNECELDFVERLKNPDVFQNGVFDAAPIGMWLLGHDPRNNYGKAFIHDPSPIISGDSLVDPSNVDYEINEQGHLLLVSKLSGRKIFLWCLHVHSKSVQIFSKTWREELNKFVKLTNNPLAIPFFSKSALWNMLSQSIKGRTLMRFLIGLPAIHRLRKWLSPLKHSILSKYRT